MPTFQLTDDRMVSIPAAPLAVRVYLASGSGRSGIEVAAVRGSKPVETDEVRRSTGGEIRMILVSVAEVMVLRLQPQEGRSFPPNTMVELNLSAEFSRSSDPYRVVLSEVDLSGLPWRDVAELSPNGPMVQIRMLAGEGTLLHGIAKEAHDAARVVLQRDSLNPEDVVDLQVVVDSTASMISWAENGLLGAVMDAVGGIDHVIGKDSLLDIRLSKDHAWRRISADDASLLARELIDAPRLTGLLGNTPVATEHTATILVTDMCPSDWAPGPRDCCVVLCQREAAPLLAHGVQVVSVSPPWDASKVIEDDELVSFVSGVLTAVLPETVLEGA
jgi:hypothetical protein